MRCRHQQPVGTEHHHISTAPEPVRYWARHGGAEHHHISTSPEPVRYRALQTAGRSTITSAHHRGWEGTGRDTRRAEHHHISTSPEPGRYQALHTAGRNAITSAHLPSRRCTGRDTPRGGAASHQHITRAEEVPGATHRGAEQNARWRAARSARIKSLSQSTAAGISQSCCDRHVPFASFPQGSYFPLSN